VRKKAVDAIRFIEEFCTHQKGQKASTPFILEKWQRAVIANLFGYIRPDGTRRYRRCLIYVPRKNGKTTLAAAIVNLVLFTDAEPGAEVYSAAAKRDQARLVFDQVCGMIRKEPLLFARAELYKHAVAVGSSSYKPIAAEATTEHGGNTHLAVIDELHAQPNRELVDVLETSTAARTQPLLVYLTTADYQHESICNEMHDYACKVRDGIIEDAAFLPVIYEADIEDDWTSPKVWARANPNLNVSLPEMYIADRCQQAKEQPSFQNTFLRLHLNVRTEQVTRLIPMDQWDACGTEPVSPAALQGRECWAGLDLATVDDLAALVLVFRDDDVYTVLPWFWCPRETAEKRERAADVSYFGWHRDGHMELTDGNSTDYRYIRRRIQELDKQYRIQEIAFDPYNATHLATELGEEDGFNVFQFRQGMLSMNEPTKFLMRLLLEGKLRHGGHPVLRWNAANAAARTDHAENVMIEKAKSAGKVDGLVAAVMGIARAMAAETGASVYDDEDYELVTL
jgi:phage terminase large subunit-like protein